MTFCNYNDIYDFCRSQEYEYRYGSVIEVNGSIVPDKSYDAPVIRTKLSDNTSITIRPDSTTSPSPCSQYDSGDIISDWECYQVWKNDNETLDPPEEVYQEFKIAKINDSYSNVMSKGYTINVGNEQISLPRDQESQTNILNALVQSIVDDTDPTIQDLNGEPITIPRSALQSQVQSYIKSNQELLKNKNEAISSVESLSSSLTTTIEFQITNFANETSCPPGYINNGQGSCISNTDIP